MRFLRLTSNLFFVPLFIVIGSKISAQNSNISVYSDIKFEQLLSEKIKSNPNLSYTDRYKIQIFSGGNENTKKIFNDFRQEYKNLDGTIIFNTPNYKIWVGNFRTRMEAERYLFEIKKKYNNVFLIKPSK